MVPRLSQRRRTEAFAEEAVGASLRCCSKSRVNVALSRVRYRRLQVSLCGCHRAAGAAPWDSGRGWHLDSFPALGSCSRLCEGCRGIHGTQGAGSFPQRVAGEFQPESQAGKRNLFKLALLTPLKFIQEEDSPFSPLPCQVMQHLPWCPQGTAKDECVRHVSPTARSEASRWSLLSPLQSNTPPTERGKLPQAPLVYLPKSCCSRAATAALGHGTRGAVKTPFTFW